MIHSDSTIKHVIADISNRNRIQCIQCQSITELAVVVCAPYILAAIAFSGQAMSIPASNAVCMKHSRNKKKQYDTGN